MIVVIIGAGIVGLHIAQAFQSAGHEVYVLDKAPYLGHHTSGRNSGVIHSGVFYQPGSFKEALCIDGNRLTYEWLDRLKIGYIPCGKWVVPEPGQEADVEAFFEKIRVLPIPSPQLLTAQRVAAEEPLLRPTRGILVPSTGILDAAAYLRALANYLESKGGQIILNCLVTGVNTDTIDSSRGPIPYDFAINAAGLFSDEIASLAELPSYEIRPCRGDYFSIPKSSKKPVYHLPYHGAHGLGVHLTPTIDGQLLIGPNAFFIDGKEDYQHRSSPEAYQKALGYFLPSLAKQEITPAYSGNRPKLFSEGKPIAEFTVIKKKNWIHLLGIESPGLTAAPALAKHVVGLI